MFRSYVRKTDQILYPPLHIIQAVQEVFSRNLTMVSASKKFYPIQNTSKGKKMEDITQLRSDSSLVDINKIGGVLLYYNYIQHKFV
jgi:hypothetical protein